MTCEWYVFGTRMDTGRQIYYADVFFFEHEYNEYNEFAMRMCIFILPQMADFPPVHWISYDSQEADKPVLPALGGDRGGR